MYNIHVDHLNTPRRITDQANTLVWKWDSKPFGDSPADDDPDGDGQSFTYNVRFPGQYYDQETGLHYNYFRDYDPGTGRYIESDPIGLNGGVNTYLYVNASPLIFIDPRGLVKIHGNWCGPDWTGGLDEQYYESPPGHYLFPKTLMDNACRAHDICYSVCREEYKCNKSGRGACMTQCDRSLAGATPIGSNSGTSVAKSVAIYVWMNYNIFPNPGENSPECSCRE